MTVSSDVAEPEKPFDFLLHALSRIEADLRDLRGEIRDLRGEMREMRTELRTEIHRLDEKLDRKVDASVFWAMNGVLLAAVIAFGGTAVTILLTR